MTEQNKARPALGVVLEQLSQLAAKSNQQQEPVIASPAGPAGGQTIGDDMKMAPERTAMIEREEALIRRVLGLFNISYDALIDPEGGSAYGEAVKANPQVVEAVMGAESPVLAALEVAVKFQPYADFIKQYGQEPDAIKAAIRDEVAAEMKAAAGEKEKTPTANSTPFSRIQREAKPKAATAAQRQALADIFNQNQ